MYPPTEVSNYCESATTMTNTSFFSCFFHFPGLPLSLSLTLGISFYLFTTNKISGGRYNYYAYNSIHSEHENSDVRRKNTKIFPLTPSSVNLITTLCKKIYTYRV